jgi:predicted DNA-binding WGR domain protein
MSTPRHSGQALRFHSIDPEKNHYRFYVILLTPTLWGSWAVVRRWGRIGTNQVRELIHECSDLDEALRVAAEQVERRLERGYRTVS